MKIGVDIDNVISDFNEELLNEALLYDKKLRNTGIVNRTKYITRGMFDWNNDEINLFYNSNIERIVKNLKLKDGAKEYIDKLKNDGHTIFIITGRDNGEYSDPYDMTKEWLDKNEIKYDKLILTNSYNYDKYIVCLENRIDIMIDDSINMCNKCIENGIKALLMDTLYNRESNLDRVNNWKEIYDYITINNFL